MADFLLDVNGDLDISQGLQITTGATEKMQRVRLALDINLNEFFADANYGLPWIKDGEGVPNIRYFLGTKVNDQGSFIKTQIDKYINSFPFVVRLSSNYKVDEESRSLTYSYIITTDEGDEVEIPPFVITV